MKSKHSEPRGILNPQAAARKFQISRRAAAHDLACYVERYWIIHWDLRGQEGHIQETLPYPCVNVVFEEGAATVYGIIRGKFSRLLENEGRVLGIKFRPGAFYPFVKIPVSRFTDRAVALQDIFGAASKTLETRIFSEADEETMIGAVETFLRERLPERDETVEQINQVVDCIRDDQTITKVDDVVEHLNLNKRTLQRLFNQYVGIGPKWVIKRYRLHEAAEQLAAGGVVDWTKLALNLGYYDQAHFIRDFKALVGVSPATYHRNSGGGV